MIKIIYNARLKKFIAAEGAQYFKDNFAFGDKWNCRVNSDGSVKCTAAETVNNKYYEICLKISSIGLVTLTNQIGGRRNPIRCFRVKGWPTTGVITLTGGPIETRNAFFYDIKSDKGMKK